MNTRNNEYTIDIATENELPMLSALSKALDTLLEKSKRDPGFASQLHYVFHEMGSRQSVIEIDATRSGQPTTFWYYDSSDRPMPINVKEVIQNLIQKLQPGEDPSKYLTDVSKLNGVSRWSPVMFGGKIPIDQLQARPSSALIKANDQAAVDKVIQVAHEQITAVKHGVQEKLQQSSTPSSPGFKP